jgi:hypothetical protein
MGLIMVIGIVEKDGILLLDADEKYRTEGRHTGLNTHPDHAEVLLSGSKHTTEVDIARDANVTRSAAATSSNLYDSYRSYLWNASSRVCIWCRFADASASRDCCYRRFVGFDLSKPHRHPCYLLQPDQNEAPLMLFCQALLFMVLI